jgi:predicted AAA+ superfamily ATPase
MNRETITLTPAGYRPRVIDGQIDKALKTFGAVSIEGPRLCGKTWTALHHARSAFFLMDDASKNRAKFNSAAALEGETPHAIDEWQEIPAIWDAVWSAADQRPGKEQFLLTGPVTLPESDIHHSGPGRIARLRMRTMSLYESGISDGSISLGALLAGEKASPGRAAVTRDDLIDAACIGGWPTNIAGNANSPLDTPIDYLHSVAANETQRSGTRIRNESKFACLLASLARNNATTVKNITLHTEVQSAVGEFAANTLAAYLQILLDLSIMEEVPGWHPPVRATAKVFAGPKRLFSDPSLVAAALGVTPAMLRKDPQAFDGVFKGLCFRDLLVYADACDAKVFHYRDNSQLEVDAIVETRDGSWGAFEIKLGGSGIEEGARALLALRRKTVNAGAPEPKCLVVLTGAEAAFPRPDGVSVVPIAMLRD